MPGANERWRAVRCTRYLGTIHYLVCWRRSLTRPPRAAPLSKRRILRQAFAR